MTKTNEELTTFAETWVGNMGDSASEAARTRMAELTSLTPEEIDGVMEILRQREAEQAEFMANYKPA